MQTSFINCFAAEWIKKRRSFASWLVLIGGFFIPFITTLIFIIRPGQILSLHAAKNFWELLFQSSWQSMAFMLLPMGIVLAVSLITQLEFKNNSWKQLHTSPVPFSSIYFSKLAVLLVMLAQLFLLFNIGIYLSAIIPSLIKSNIPFPKYPINFTYFLQENTKYFIVCLPMISLQYLLSLHFKNFLVPIGTGLALVIGGLMALSWEHVHTIPFSYTALLFIQNKTNATPVHNLMLWSVGYFIVFTLLGLVLYILKKEKG